METSVEIKTLLDQYPTRNIRKPIFSKTSKLRTNQTLVEYWTKGSKTTPGYHIGLIIENDTVVGLYNNGEPGKSHKDRLIFAKTIIERN